MGLLTSRQQHIAHHRDAVTSDPTADDLSLAALVVGLADEFDLLTEVGTPDGVATAIAEQTGVPVVEIATHTLPEDGSYFTFMRDMAAAVSRGLDPPAGG